MNSSILEKYYSQTRISEEQRQKLTDFSVMEVISYHFKFIKENFKEGFLFPYLWKLLVDFILVVILLAAYAGIIISYIGQSLNFDDLEEFERFWQQNVGQIWEMFGLLVAVTLVVVIPGTILHYYLSLRHHNLLNNRQLKSIWQSQKSLMNNFGQALLGQLILFLIRIPIWVGGAFLSFYAFANVYNYSIRQGQTPIEGLDFLVGWGYNPLFAFFLVFFGFLLIIVLDQVLIGFVGLFDQLILYEDETAWSAIVKSFKISKVYYLENVLRWFLFGLILFGFGIVFGIVEQIVSQISEFSFIFIDTERGWQSFFLIASIIYFVLNYLVSVVRVFVESTLFASFAYVAFYNFRASTLEKVEVAGPKEEVS